MESNTPFLDEIGAILIASAILILLLFGLYKALRHLFVPFRDGYDCSICSGSGQIFEDSASVLRADCPECGGSGIDREVLQADIDEDLRVRIAQCMLASGGNSEAIERVLQEVVNQYDKGPGYDVKVSEGPTKDSIEVQIVEMDPHVGCRCAHCGAVILSDEDATSSPHGSMHADCAVANEAQNPEHW